MLGRRCASRCRSPAEAVRLPLLLSLLLLLPPPAAANLATLEQIVACNTATLALKGDARCGGDSSDVAAELSGGVQPVVGSPAFGGGAFAVVKVDGSVVTWGDRCRERGSRWSSTGGRGERPAGRAELLAKEGNIWAHAASAGTGTDP